MATAGSGRTLKGQNNLRLTAVVIGNAVLYYTMVSLSSAANVDVSAFVKNWHNAVPGILALALVGVLNAQVPANAKAVIVFWRWQNALPGARAFSLLIDTDPRIDVKRLEELYGALPVNPKEQNRLWYRMYKQCEDVAAVVEAHREYLFTRDYATMALVFGLVLGIAAAVEAVGNKTMCVYGSILALQYVMTRQAAKNNGHRLVTSVLAATSAK